MTIPARYTLTEAHFRIADLERELADAQWERDNYATMLKFARQDRDAFREKLLSEPAVKWAIIRLAVRVQRWAQR